MSRAPSRVRKRASVDADEIAAPLWQTLPGRFQPQFVNASLLVGAQVRDSHPKPRGSRGRGKTPLPEIKIGNGGIPLMARVSAESSFGSVAAEFRQET